MGVDPLCYILLKAALRNRKRKVIGVTFGRPVTSDATIGSRYFVPVILPPVGAPEDLSESLTPYPPGASVVLAVPESVKWMLPSSTPIYALLTSSDLAAGKEESFLLDSIPSSMSLVPFA